VRIDPIETDALLLREVGAADVVGSVGGEPWVARWDATATLPTGVVHDHYRFLACSTSGVTISGVAQVWFDGRTTAVTTTFKEDGATHGRFVGRGDLGVVSISADAVAAVDSADLRGASMTSLTIARTAGASLVSVDANGAEVSGAVTVGAGCSVEVATKRNLYGAVTTTAATPAKAIITVPVSATAQTVFLNAYVTARDSAGNGAGYIRIATFKSAGGGAAWVQVGVTGAAITHEDVGGWDCTVAVVANEIVVTVTGDAANDTDFVAQVELRST
jgi:hypothetical protein